MPVFGTCAGMILLATDVLDGRPDQRSFGAIDLAVRRNGYGRQVDSFETDIDVVGLDEPFHAVFIRAPKVESTSAPTSRCWPSTTACRCSPAGPRVRSPRSIPSSPAMHRLAFAVDPATPTRR